MLNDKPSILIDELPRTLCGAAFRCDYKTILRVIEIQEGDADDMEKAVAIVGELFDGAPPNDQNLWEELREFITMGESDEGSGGESVFDFREDAGRLYAAFRQAYGIDLTTENLHWWQFVELFKSLPDDTMLKRVIEIRAKPIDPNASAEQRIEQVKLKERFALKGKLQAGSVLGPLFGR
jgi:hypothetical protein